MKRHKGGKKINRRFLKRLEEDIVASLDQLTESIATLGRAVSAHATSVSSDINMLKAQVANLQEQVASAEVTQAKVDTLKAAIDSITASIITAGMAEAPETAEPESHATPEPEPGDSSSEPPL